MESPAIVCKKGNLDKLSESNYTVPLLDMRPSAYFTDDELYDIKIRINSDVKRPFLSGELAPRTIGAVLDYAIQTRLVIKKTPEKQILLDVPCLADILREASLRLQNSEFQWELFATQVLIVLSKFQEGENS